MFHEVENACVTPVMSTTIVSLPTTSVSCTAVSVTVPVVCPAATTICVVDRVTT